MFTEMDEQNNEKSKQMNITIIIYTNEKFIDLLLCVGKDSRIHLFKLHSWKCQSNSEMIPMNRRENSFITPLNFTPNLFTSNLSSLQIFLHFKSHSTYYLSLTRFTGNALQDSHGVGKAAPAACSHCPM